MVGFGRHGDALRPRALACGFGALLLACGPQSKPPPLLSSGLIEPRRQNLSSRAPFVTATHAASDSNGRGLLCWSEGGNVDGAESVKQTLARLRGYRDRLDIGCRSVAPSAWPELLSAELEQLAPTTVSHEMDAALATLGLLPTGYDSRAAMLRQLLGELRGVYLSASREIALASGQDTASRDSSLLHELVHAYQDRDYGLGERLRYRPEASDAVAALHAFAEGEALTLELLASTQDESSLPSVAQVTEALTATSASLQLPPLLQRSVTAPYVDGYRFVTHLRQQGGWPLVERVWRRGLVGTRELLHPEIFVPSCLSGDCARVPAATLPEALAAPWNLNATDGLRYRDSLGEQGLRLILEEGLAEADAAGLASHLATDRLSSYSVDQGRAVLWQLRLIDGQSASPLCQALESVLSLDTTVTPKARCIRRQSTFGTVGCGKRDILVLFRSHADTWTEQAQTAGCGQARAWVRARLAEPGRN
jgi:hypothetical protein